MDDPIVRTERLERDVRHSRVIAQLALVIAVGTLGLAAGYLSKDAVMGRPELRLRDANATAVLTPSALEFRDAAGVVRERIGFVQTDLPGLYMIDKKDGIRVRFDLDAEGSPVLRYFDANHTSRAWFGIQENNSAIVLQDDQAIRRSILACKNNQPKLELWGEDNKPRYLTASKPLHDDEVFCIGAGKTGRCSPE